MPLRNAVKVSLEDVRLENDRLRREVSQHIQDEEPSADGQQIEQRHGEVWKRNTRGSEDDSAEAASGNDISGILVSIEGEGPIRLPRKRSKSMGRPGARQSPFTRETSMYQTAW